MMSNWPTCWRRSRIVFFAIALRLYEATTEALAVSASAGLFFQECSQFICSLGFDLTNLRNYQITQSRGGAPTPRFHPISPNVTQCHPTGAPGKPGVPNKPGVGLLGWKPGFGLLGWKPGGKAVFWLGASS